MKLYYAPGACSLAGRISLHEAGILADFEKVDLATKVTENGDDYAAINPRGYVPMLVLDDGESVTENTAVLAYIAECEPALSPEGPLARIRLIEILTYLSTELHGAFKPYFHEASETEKAAAGETIAGRLRFLAEQIDDHYLFGRRFTVADAYLFAMLRWAMAFGVQVPANLVDYFERIAASEIVRRSLAEEGLT
ncbi:glutathione binding-like protein [Parasphingopyxis marina]|uniref:Glutathione S-transferase N-terminal domain-containing protein n=1 Tax=Parasphingopyxis marina TaxID=2761622 RepID=A0A842I2X9_9SPHN|nr:glutathione binding-like protein [Parasphingopyxis marina]MBC2779153.1 glutathione S-transferase N-terminal domain-containing protein [Parasphingopyxis marina]